MRYTKTHKADTRRRILDAAITRFREDGAAGTGIGELMSQLGLTHGGFYAHFDSKGALVAEACAAGLADGAERLERITASAFSDPLAAFIDFYLSEGHRDHPGKGCVLPTMAAEVAREDLSVRHVFTQALQGYLSQVAEHVSPQPDGTPPGDEVLALTAGLAGAMLLARAVDDPDLSRRFLEATRTLLKERFVPAAEPGGRSS